MHSKKYDAIVIGTGITGGWAAKELCENGLKTLVLERGRMVKHIDDYHTVGKDTWDFKYRNQVTREEFKRQEKQDRTGYAVRESHKHWFVDDIEHPYDEAKRFDWIRGYHVGGRSITWGRQALRLSDIDFEANLKDGYGVDWPIRYKDLASWYDKVEKYIGVSGEKMGLEQLPDGVFSPPMDLNCVEEEFREHIAKTYKNRCLTIGRVAHLTGTTVHEGRSNCKYINQCIRGCNYGGYFSSLSSTLPAAERTGNMDLRPNSIVHEIVYDATTGLASGVKVIDAETHENFEFSAEIIFCCASTIPTTSILMQSTSKRFPNGLGNDSGELGHNLMDHHFKAGAVAEYDGYLDKYYKGRRPAGFMIPRFQNLKEQDHPFLRGYFFQGGASRTNWRRTISELSYGEKLKEELTKPGPWRIGMTGYGECLPYHENKMILNYDKLDDWGLPTVVFDCEYKENERKMRVDMKEQAVQMFKKAGFKNVKAYETPCFPGNGIHEMGTARMGRDPKTSVLNKYNQIHAVPNVYVTDGACMTSSACQNPSLTYMAITARAAHHAVEQFKKGTFKSIGNG